MTNPNPNFGVIGGGSWATAIVKMLETKYNVKATVKKEIEKSL